MSGALSAAPAGKHPCNGLFRRARPYAPGTAISPMPTFRRPRILPAAQCPMISVTAYSRPMQSHRRRNKPQTAFFGVAMMEQKGKNFLLPARQGFILPLQEANRADHEGFRPDSG